MLLLAYFSRKRMSSFLTLFFSVKFLFTTTAIFAHLVLQRHPACALPHRWDLVAFDHAAPTRSCRLFSLQVQRFAHVALSWMQKACCLLTLNRNLLCRNRRRTSKRMRSCYRSKNWVLLLRCRSPALLLSACNFFIILIAADYIGS